MNISPDEAEEELAAIQRMMQKTRHSIASSGAHTSLIVTGVVWLVGFLCTQFLSGELLTYIWIGISLLGGALATLLGMRSGKRVRSPATAATARRASLLAAAGPLCPGCHRHRPAAGREAGHHVHHPVHHDRLDGHGPAALLLRLLVAGRPSPPWRWSATSCCPVFSTCGWAILVGGGMIALGLYIRSRW